MMYCRHGALTVSLQILLQLELAEEPALSHHFTAMFMPAFAFIIILHLTPMPYIIACRHTVLVQVTRGMG
jgi:hypothetical protein